MDDHLAAESEAYIKKLNWARRFPIDHWWLSFLNLLRLGPKSHWPDQPTIASLCFDVKQAQLNGIGNQSPLEALKQFGRPIHPYGGSFDLLMFPQLGFEIYAPQDESEKFYFHFCFYFRPDSHSASHFRGKLKPCRLQWFSLDGRTIEITSEITKDNLFKTFGNKPSNELETGGLREFSFYYESCTARVALDDSGRLHKLHVEDFPDENEESLNDSPGEPRIDLTSAWPAEPKVTTLRFDLSQAQLNGIGFGSRFEALEPFGRSGEAGVFIFPSLGFEAHVTDELVDGFYLNFGDADSPFGLSNLEEIPTLKPCRLEWCDSEGRTTVISKETSLSDLESLFGKPYENPYDKKYRRLEFSLPTCFMFVMGDARGRLHAIHLLKPR